MFSGRPAWPEGPGPAEVDTENQNYGSKPFMFGQRLLEKPKLQPYINTIKESVAHLLRIPVDHTNIKATTSETMGFIGRGEGIVCYATVLIQKT